MAIEFLFPTQLYKANLKAAARAQKQMLAEIEDIAGLDIAGKSWSQENYRNGFTSYASANNLHRISPTFGALEKEINLHVKKFSLSLEQDLQGEKLEMTNCWVNIMPANVYHGSHLHPLSVISGTYYVKVPRGASAIKFEDPRFTAFMGAPPKKQNASRKNKTFVEVSPAAGSLILFESWLRHEVPINTSKEPRISVSFNYGWR
ncbi:MAG: TIGR02466 family protein [Bdellovibrionota bacterium]